MGLLAIGFGYGVSVLLHNTYELRVVWFYLRMDGYSVHEQDELECSIATSIVFIYVQLMKFLPQTA